MKIREYRLKANLTQQELADKICVSKQFISELEKNLKHPSVPVLVHLAYILDTCPCCILEFKCQKCSNI